MSSNILSTIIPQKESEDNEFVTIDGELEPNEESDEEMSHSKLINDISLLSSNRKKDFKWKATRFESKPDVNEYNLSKGDKQISINELIKSVKDSSGRVHKDLRHWDKKKLLEAPLERPIADQIKRKVAFDQVVEEVSKWDSVVEANRSADQLHFPLKQNNLRLEPAREVVKHFKPETKLEIEVAEVLQKSDNAMNEDLALTVAEEKLLKAMSLEEAKLRHKDLQRMRALLSFQEVKLKRQAKIKSKRYHRILKKEKLKKGLEQFESDKKNNPELAIEKLNELEKLRALERASLKHKNTGKWAKHNKLRSKYDENARNALSDQLQLSKQLTQKRVTFDSDEEENNKSSSDNEEEKELNNDFDFNAIPNDFNPWMRSGRKSSEMNKTTSQNSNHMSEPIDEDLNNEPIIYETTSGVNIEDNDIIYNNNKQIIENNDLDKNALEISSHTESQEVIQIDPNNFMAMKSHKVNSLFPNLITELESEDESIASDEEQRKLVSEAFAEDDVVNDFKKTKREKIENEEEKSICLHLPGWGSWGGVGIKQSKRKIKQFTKKAKKRQRKDGNLVNVIISEKKDEAISKFRVNQLPFPFKNVSQFENSIRQPIGRTWNPETAFRSLTEPKVVTKMGAIIEPIDSSEMIKAKVKRPQIKKRIKKINNS